MHLLVPFASDGSPACQHVLADLALPHLERLLVAFDAVGRDEGDALSLSPPHERALAAAWGWSGSDGTLPFAARTAAIDEVLAAPAAGAPPLAWALLTPAHWQLGRDHVTVIDPAELALDEAESKALFESVRGLLESEGFVARWGHAGRWYAARADLDGIATASLDRVIGRSLDSWLRPPHGDTTGQAATRRLLRRLQSEAQLVLHEHPVNEAREERGALAVNSFWLSGCGQLQPTNEAATPTVDASLRRALLAGDWAAWADAWHALDSGAIASLMASAQAGGTAALTLCGERSAARFATRQRSPWRRLASRWQRSEPHRVLAAL
ncbi:MAG: hypothetical protein ABIO71_08270 [Caldimonas sp.]